MLDPDVRKILYQDLYDALCGQDWNTVYEATGIDPLFDEIANGNDCDPADDGFDDEDENSELEEGK